MCRSGFTGTPERDETGQGRLKIMSVKLNTRQVGDVTVIDVSGRITLGEGSSVIRDECTP